MTTFEWIQTLASIATALGVAIAARQLLLTKQQVQSQFEDSFAEQYRRISSQMPLAALPGQPLCDTELETRLRAFYEYFDLSNEQAFLAVRGRLRPETWRNWREGIERMSRPAFQRAWQRLAPHLDGSFDEFKSLLTAQVRRDSPGPQPVG